MKKLFVLLMFMGITAASYAQDQNVKIGPLGFLFGNYNLRYEKTLSDKGTMQVGANFYSFEVFDVGSTGFGVDAGYRHYFKEATRGAYVYPSANFDFNSTSVSVVDDTKAGYSILGLGATIGYQWVTGGNFVIDLGFGWAYQLEVSKDDSLVSDFGGGTPRFQFALGYAF